MGETGSPRLFRGEPCGRAGAVSVCAPWAAAAGRVPLDKVGTPVTLDKGRNGSHSIICKVTCCVLSLFLLHSFYLYLNVLGNLRTNVKVKMQ